MDIVYKVYFISIQGIKSIVGELFEKTERRKTILILISTSHKNSLVILVVMTQREWNRSKKIQEASRCRQFVSMKSENS
jgi:hypothetical protein